MVVALIATNLVEGGTTRVEVLGGNYRHRSSRRYGSPQERIQHSVDTKTSCRAHKQETTYILLSSLDGVDLEQHTS
jgi:hypothetical protein